MQRLNRHERLIKTALIMAEGSTCNRLKVGAVIAKDGRIISTGFNGAPSGLPHCDPEICNDNNPCTRTVHAEAGAIVNAAKHGIGLDGSSMYVTNSPCVECAKLIIHSGIRSVYYLIAYRIQDGVNLLISAGVNVEKL